MFKISVEVEGINSRLTEALFTGIAIAMAKKSNESQERGYILNRTIIAITFLNSYAANTAFPNQSG